MSEEPNGIIRMDFELWIGYDVNLVDIQDNIRHGGKMNALRMEGAVRLRRPDEIDAAEAPVAKRRWPAVSKLAHRRGHRDEEGT